MRKRSTYLLPLLTFVLWGSLYVVSKDVMTQIPPVTLLFLRYVTACLALFVCLKIRRTPLPPIKRKDRGAFLLVGFAGYALAIALQQISTSMLDAALASLINAINPIFICLMAFLILRERITAEQIMGILLAIAGVYIILGVSGSGASIAGILVSLSSVFFWSLCSVMIRKVTKAYDPIIITFYGMLLALIPTAPAMLVELHFRPILITLPGILQVLYLGLVTTCAAHVLWNKGLQRMPAAACSAFYPVQPLTSALLGVLFLHEPITSSFIWGSAAISCGILLSIMHLPLPWRRKAAAEGPRQPDHRR